jgi:2'-hydroxyisoflavone reductase
MKKILILGGTHFLGRALLDEIAANVNYDITLFNRGKTNPDIFPNLSLIKGDRETDDIKQLFSTSWDIVVDFCCYFPNSLQKLLNGLKHKVGRYIFISTGSVYDFESHKGELIPENFVLKSCTLEQREDQTMQTYGERKAECERVLLSTEWLDTIILRPSIVYGKYDPFDRHYYWLLRAKTCKKAILPDAGKQLANYTFVEDLVDIVIQSFDIKKHRKVYNMVSHDAVPLSHTVAMMNAQFENECEYINTSSNWLAEQKVKPYHDITLWIGVQSFLFENKKLKTDFNTNFPDIAESFVKTIEFYDSIDYWENESKYGLSREAEAKLIEKHKAQHN